MNAMSQSSFLQGKIFSQQLEGCELINKTQNPPRISASAGFEFEFLNEGCLFFAGLAATYSSAS
jgi:hypothetical protein